MSTLLFYRDQAEKQQEAADAAVLQNVRERCQRAADAWATLAARSEHNDSVRAARVVQTAASAQGAANDASAPGLTEA